MAYETSARIRHVTAVLGPTNTGKTHLAIERMLGHETGMIGLPLRLLAREVYDRVANRVGPDKVALITGEEKIKPEGARYWVCTVEAMPPEIDVDFLAIDEIQLAADPERGHVFTDRLLHARGKLETLVLGAGTMRDAIADLIPGSNFISRPRLSKLTWAGQKKITRLPGRSVIVAFSAAEVYAIAELIRRQRGGAAVVLGALSPRTRNAQVALYQSGDVEYLVATDAIGMGLNLDVDHVAFSAIRKFDGQNHRNLTPAELSQIAGRAGRHMNDGTFGVTADVDPFDADLIERLENHSFEPLKTLQWRGRDIDFSSVDGLRDSLRTIPKHERLMRARMADDVLALETLSADREVLDLARSREAVEQLWGVCQVPDYRKISPQAHAEIVAKLFKDLRSGNGRIDEDWFAKQVAFSDRTDGDIDTLSNRLAHIRTWTFVAQRPDWLTDPGHWQERTRAIEDALSDALHECLTQRFVDRRTSALMKGLKAKDELTADIGEDGAIQVENHYVGRLVGFRFSPDTQADNVHGKATRHAAAQVLAKEIGMRARRVAAAKADAFKLTRNGRILWRDAEIARLEAGDDPLKPSVMLIADEHLQGGDREKVQERLLAWIGEITALRLKSLVDIAKAEDISGLARGIAFRLTESFGVLRRETIADEIKSLDQTARAQLRKYGVRFGAFNIFFPLLLKPAAAELLTTLWALKHAAASGLELDAMPEPPRPGLTSVATDAALPEAYYRVLGFHVCGPRAVRVDILERLADLIRPLLAWKPNPANPSAPPKGATGEGGFTVTPEMMSILGCSTDELGAVLKALGFRLDRKPLASLPKVNVPPKSQSLEQAAAALAALGRAAEGQPDAIPDASAATASADPTDIDVASEPAPVPAQSDTPSAASPTAETPSDATTVPAVSAPETPMTSTEAAASTEAAVSATELAEPEMVDIWRPRRRHERGEHGERRERGPRRGPRSNEGGERRGQGAGYRGRGQQAAPTPTADGSPTTTEGAAGTPGNDARPDRGGYRGRDRGPGGGERRQQNAPGDRPQGDRPPRGDGDRRPDGRRDENRGGGRPGGGDRRPDGGRPHGGPDRGRDRGGKPGGDRRRDDRGGAGGGAPRVITAAPPRGKAADPDSPFAKLVALKQALEQKARDPKSS